MSYGFIQSPTNNILPMCLIFQSVLSNKTCKTTRTFDNSTADRKDKDLSYFLAPEEKYLKQPTLPNSFQQHSNKMTMALTLECFRETFF